jgi:heterotetrameric sarcosine oxidase delta subunit
MRILCPYCGERDHGEFSYLGDASAKRPVFDAPEAAVLFFEAAYLRTNPSGPLEELWYHAQGCRAWLRVTRNTLTHEITTVHFAHMVAEQW